MKKKTIINELGENVEIEEPFEIEVEDDDSKTD